MVSFILAIILLLLAILALTLEKTYFYRPAKELKRLALSGDQLSSTLFQAETYGGELKLLLWFVTGLSAGGGFVLFARSAPMLLSFLAVVITLWLAFLWIPRTRLTVVGANLAVLCTPVVVWLLKTLHPLSLLLTRYSGRYIAESHTGLYERGDVYELIERQKSQVDNRISHQELGLMRSVLEFGDHHVRDLLIPKRKVKAINLNDSIGPVLLDELHATGHLRFPVYEGKPTNIVGMFTANDVADLTQHGKVQDFYERQVAYVHEEDNLEESLRAFYDTQQPMLVVVNSFNEYVGIITLHDTLHQLLGTSAEEDPKQRSDRKAVAASYAQKEEKDTDQELEVENVPENSSEVIE